MKTTPLPQQSKALAGAVVAFLGTAANHLINGNDLAVLLQPGIELLQLGAATGITYLVVFWTSNKGVGT